MSSPAIPSPSILAAMDEARLPPTDGHSSLSPPSVPIVRSEIEFRQIAGLTAGETMNLAPGSYDFGSDDSNAATFSLEIGADCSTIFVVPGESGVFLDVDLITERTPLNGRTINAGSARFRVGTPRPVSRDRRSVIAGGAPQIEIPTISAEFPTGAPQQLSGLIPKPDLRPSTLGGFLNRSRRDVSPSGRSSGSLSQLANPNHLIDRLLVVRAQLAEQHREQHPDPEEIARRARIGPKLAWHRRSDHWHFGQVSIATADIAWQPRLDDRNSLSDYQRDLVRTLGILPSVPVTADLRVGPLGIVGPRAAALACARHVLTYLATLSSPDHLTISVLADDDRKQSWDWAHKLPHTNRSAISATPLLVIDGVEQLNDNGFGMALTEPGGVGSILLADDTRSLPSTCATVLILDKSGTAEVLHHRNGLSVSGATPHGISTRLASDTAIRLMAANNESGNESSGDQN